MPVLKVHSADVYGAGIEANQIKNVTPVQRQVLDLGGANCGRQFGVFRVHGGSFAGDLHYLLGLAQLHSEIDALDGPCIQHQIGVCASLEAFGLGSDLVCSDG